MISTDRRGYRQRGASRLCNDYPPPDPEMLHIITNKDEKYETENVELDGISGVLIMTLTIRTQGASHFQGLFDMY